MLGLFDDLSQQSSGGSEVIILIGEQVLEHHRQELQTQRENVEFNKITELNKFIKPEKGH